MHPIFYEERMSKLFIRALTYHRMRSDHSLSPTDKILGVIINRNPRIRIRGRITDFTWITVNSNTFFIYKAGMSKLFMMTIPYHRMRSDLL